MALKAPKQAVPGQPGGACFAAWSQCGHRGSVKVGSQGCTGTGQFPSPAKAQQRLCRARTTGSSESSGAWAARRPRAWASKSSSRSPPSHRPHRRSVNCPACCRRRAPPRGAGRSTAFGSMSRSHQASAELWCATAARARQGIGPTKHERLWAHAEVPVCQKKGGASRATTGAAEALAAGRHRGWAPIESSGKQKATYPTVVQAVGCTISCGIAPCKVPVAWSSKWGRLHGTPIHERRGGWQQGTHPQGRRPLLARRRAVETAHAPWPQHPPAWRVGLGVVPLPRAGHATANQTSAGRPAAARRGLASGPKPGSGIWSGGVAAGGQWPAVAPTNVGGGAAKRSRPHC